MMSHDLVVSLLVNHRGHSTNYCILLLQDMIWSVLSPVDDRVDAASRDARNMHRDADINGGCIMRRSRQPGESDVWKDNKGLYDHEG